MKYRVSPSGIVYVSLFSAVSVAEGVKFVEQKPQVVNAIEYQQSLDLADYFVSEKLDGIRAVWTGAELVTRSGRVINAPRWFTAPLPDLIIEGELWAGRNQFSLVQKTVLDKIPDEKSWQSITFMLFDVPGHLGTFEKRYEFLRSYCDNNGMTHIRCVEQKTVSSHGELQQYLQQLTSRHAEGLMLKLRHEVYHPGRNRSLVKMKTVQDMDGVVVGYKQGKGKYQGQLGSLLIELDDGVRFYLGSGLSDSDRKNPPKVGEVVTFKHNGWTVNGIPRFARFYRIREVE
ncbi:DNA ligase [Vibrio hangzhouensis]|nr:DNA ligase [Vibrio hangzhouensis]